MKFLSILLILFFSSSIVNSKISKPVFKEFIEGCHLANEAIGDYSIEAREVCLCMTNILSANFNDEDLITLYNNPDMYERFIKGTVKPKCKK